MNCCSALCADRLDQALVFDVTEADESAFLDSLSS